MAGQLNAAVPGQGAGWDVHVVLDNLSAHKTPAIHRWLAAHPSFHLHFTPTSSSWLNLVERWFGELTTKSLQRSTHRSVREHPAGSRAAVIPEPLNQDHYVASAIITRQRSNPVNDRG